MDFFFLVLFCFGVSVYLLLQVTFDQLAVLNNLVAVRSKVRQVFLIVRRAAQLFSVKSEVVVMATQKQKSGSIAPATAPHRAQCPAAHEQ